MLATETKKKSWAIPENQEEPEMPPEKEMIDAQTKIEMMRIQALFEIAKELSEIKNELKLQRVLYEQVNEIETKIVDSDEKVEDTDTGEGGFPVASRRGDPPKPVVSAIPTNLKDSKEIEEYYRGKIKESNILNEKELEKMIVAVEETYVRVKPPYLSDTEKFRAIAAVLRKLGGEYIKDGANTHYKMPKPSTT